MAALDNLRIVATVKKSDGAGAPIAIGQLPLL